MANRTSLLVLVHALLSSGVAVAADPVAESMFQQAVDEMKSGNFESACPKLEASQKLEARSGTLMTLASCSEQLGKTATAWAQYKDAAALARQEGREDYADKATALASKLEPRLSKIRIDAPERPGGVQITVRLDEKQVLSGTFGVAFAIDPGEHRVEASAPGRVPWATTVTIGREADSQIVAVPSLEVQTSTQPASAPASSDAARPTEPDELTASPGVADVPWWAWASGGVGIVAVATSVVFAVDQRKTSAEIDDRCGGTERALCPLGYDFDAAHAREKRDFGLFVGLGAVGLAGLGVAAAGIVMTATSGDDGASVVLAPHPNGLTVRGTF